MNDVLREFIIKKAKRFNIDEEKLLLAYKFYKKYAASYGDIYTIFFLMGTILSKRSIRHIIFHIKQKEKKMFEDARKKVPKK